MSCIPDCRTDEWYNEKYLNVNDKNFVAGYDWAVEQALCLLDNANVYPKLEMLLAEGVAVTSAGKDDIIREALKNWMEMSRDELITSMIDGMDDDEYNQNKAEVTE